MFLCDNHNRQNKHHVPELNASVCVKSTIMTLLEDTIRTSNGTIVSQSIKEFWELCMLRSDCFDGRPHLINNF